MPQDPMAILTQKGVESDRLDLRDLTYTPPLTTLRRSAMPDGALFRTAPPDQPQGGRLLPLFGVRDQGHSARCTGFALAALIDMQRRLQAASAPEPIGADDERSSAEMLYQLARLHDLYPQDDDTTDDGARAVARMNRLAGITRPRRDGIRSLRSVLKAFYHHGVCLENGPDTDACWPTAELTGQSEFDAPEITFPTAPQADAARAVPLGAYYRLAPILHHYHAALTDTGTALVAAHIHDGWSAQAVAEAGGEIRMTTSGGRRGSHAFVLIGYDEHGFLVLNSWGPDWGGYRGYAGVALWRYADWARNVMDGWVLRLGVPAPDSFEFTLGRQGAGPAQEPASNTTPCIALIGRYLTLEDGEYTRLGAYPSSPALLENSLQGLGGADWKGVVLWLSSGLHLLGESFTAAARRRAAIEAMGYYPFTLFWAGNFGESAIQALQDSAERSIRIAGSNGADGERLRDLVFEGEIRSIGRAIWREIQANATRAVWGDARPPEGSPAGPAFDMLRHMLNWTGPQGLPLHIVAEGTGTLVADALVEALRGRPGTIRDAWSASLASLQLVLPAIRLDQATQRLLPLIGQLNQRPASDRPEPAGPEPLNGPVARGRIYLPNPDIEQRLVLDGYGRGFLELVANACERRDPRTGEPPLMLGQARAAQAAPFDDAALHMALTRVTSLGAAYGGFGRMHQLKFDRLPAFEAEIMRNLHSFPDRD